MKAVETFGIKWESTGADKIKKDLKESRIESDNAEKSLNAHADSSKKLEKNIRELSIEQKKATEEDKKRIVVEKVHAKTSQDNIVSMTKKQKDADKTAGLFTDKNKSLAESLMKIGKVTAAVAIPLGLLKKGFDSVSAFGEKGNALSLLSEQAMSSTAKTQDIGLASKVFGGDAASASAMMNQLKMNLQAMKFDEGGGALWEAASKYGLKISGSKKGELATGEELLRNIAERMETQSKEDQLLMGSMIGLDMPTIMLLREGSAKFEARMAEASKSREMNQAQIDKSNVIKKETERLKANISKVKTDLSTDFSYGSAGVMRDLSNLLENPNMKAAPMPDAIKRVFGMPTKLEGRPPTIPLGGGRTTSSTSPSIIIQSMEVNTQATNADGTGQAIAEAITNELGIVVNQLSNGEK